jgi:pimeloyl-ACP methyl ester carboxylesterase
MNYVTSRDGTRIAYEPSGIGPALLLVDGALCSRGFGPSGKLAEALSTRFTVYRYDRRGRGTSSDTSGYSPEREVDDIAALIDRAGGSASLLGLSSGGALCLDAAAAGLPVEHVLVYEPPYVHEGTDISARHLEVLRGLVSTGDRGGAVTYFMRDMVGAPAFVPVMMRLMPWVWRKLQAVAHTLPYDAEVMTGFRIPRTRYGAIRRRVLVMNGTKTDPRLKAAARALAAIIPGAEHRELAGQTHNVKPGVLASAVWSFISGVAASHRS